MTAENLRHRVIVALVLLFVSLVGLKILYYDYSPAAVLPVTGYKVRIEMEATGNLSPFKLTAALPSNSDRQTILNHSVDSSSFNFSIFNKDGNRLGYWRSRQLSGSRKFSFVFEATCNKVIYELPDSLAASSRFPEENDRIASQVDITATEERVLAKMRDKLGLSPNSDPIQAIKDVYSFIVVGGQGDRLMPGELNIFNNDRNRLFVAMMQTLALPARLVGGLVLDPDRPRKTHRWAQIYLGDQWVSFDLTHQVFAELPENYLIVNHDNEAFFKCSSNTDFKYNFRVERKTFHNDPSYARLGLLPLNIMTAWPFLQRTGLSLNLLRIMLMIPFGAVVLIIFRNVIGIQTFGIFLPVLIASAFGESGMWGGLITFTVITLAGTVLRIFLDRLRILHTPKLAIMLVYVVFALLGISILGMKFNQTSFGQATLFPLAVMAITIERFSTVVDESGIQTAFTILANTILTVIFCYLAISSVILQALMLAFPEIILLVISMSIYLGAWKGLRLSELIRFRKLIFHQVKRI